MSKIAIIYGTFSEKIRLDPIVKVLEANNIITLLVQTEQYTLQTTENFLYSAHILARDITNWQSAIIKQLNDTLDKESLDGIIVIGNSLSAFCGAFYGYLRKLRVFHINAGQRTYDLHNAFPEEGFGQLITKLTNVHFVMTKFTKKNLIKEGINKKNIFIVGNTLQDIIQTKHLSANSEKDEILFSIHRNENIKNIKSICMGINYLAQMYQSYVFNIILPKNITTSKEMQRFILPNNNVNIINTLTHDETLALINRSKLICTDSFGIQEEATLLQKPTFILRNKTESIESIKTGAARLLSPEEYTLFTETIAKALNHELKFKIKECKYYKKNTAINIYTVMNNYLKKSDAL